MPESATTAGQERLDPGEIESVYDRLGLEILHFGYWHDDADPATLEEASDQLTDLVHNRLAIPPGARLLDVGCGTGVPAVRIGGSGDASVLGITVSARQAETATVRAGCAGLGDRLQFRVADAMDMPFEDNSFDAAYALESIHHMDRPTVLRELARVVRPGGTVVATDVYRRAPAPAGGPPVLDLLAPMWMMTPPCSFEAYPGLFEAAGLQLAERRDISSEVLPRTFGAVRERFLAAVAAGEAASLPATGELDLTDPGNQSAVVDFIGLMCETDEVGYALLVATVTG
ncbi:methyltransferase type 11 [Kineosporia sp. NBRC 101677]|uniref:SAM-dependent methyltransferase n=1 Tax=Kineosporia sp. NBRC 101677 TaxID=3032197 RepID=UPI0024A0171A|nr:methyltransferase domain-containing protein [Kineosporia sp. NBRC 101677]GLY15212.1 methyltransferase type 11 [Kineosporia sp. NBRC 101677]